MGHSNDTANEEARGPRNPPRPAAASRFRSGLTIADLALQKAAATPQSVAVREADGRQTSFAAILPEAQAIAAGLQRLGIQAGDTISFQLPNWREAVAINIAAAMLGLRVNPITPIYRGAELRIILADARSKVLFIPEVFRSINYPLMIDDLRA